MRKPYSQYTEEQKNRSKARANNWRKKNPDKAKLINKKKTDERYKIMTDAKSKPCMDCGNLYPPYMMDFDHRDPNTKEFNVAHKRSLSISRIQQEIAKCDVVCANCHRRRTFIRKNQVAPGAF